MPDGQRGVPVVPHIVRPRDALGGAMRRELGIAPSTTVFGRYGGADPFSIEEVDCGTVKCQTVMSLGKLRTVFAAAQVCRQRLR